MCTENTKETTWKEQFISWNDSVMFTMCNNWPSANCLEIVVWLPGPIAAEVVDRSSVFIYSFCQCPFVYSLFTDSKVKITSGPPNTFPNGFLILTVLFLIQILSLSLRFCLSIQMKINPLNGKLNFFQLYLCLVNLSDLFLRLGFN